MEIDNRSQAQATVRAAIIGCGRVAHTHAQALQALASTETYEGRAQLVAVCSRSRDKVERFAQTYGADAYTDCEEMLPAANVQMVSICTPHPSHAELVEAAANHGVHALVEKPLAPDLSGCDRAISACRNAGVKLGVISQRRLYLPVTRMQRAIAAGVIGQPILAILLVRGWRGQDYYNLDPWRGRWDLEGGGVLVNQVVHQLDLLQWLMGPVQELHGYWDNYNHPYVDVDDTAVAALRFRSGAMGVLAVSNSQNPGLGGTLHIHGSNGASIGAQTDGGSMFVSGVTAEVDPPLTDLWSVPGEAHLLSTWQEEERHEAARVDVMSYYHQRQIEDFARAILEDREPMVDGLEGRKVVEIFTAIYRSQRDGRPVRFPLPSEDGAADYDGRLSHTTCSHGHPFDNY